MNTTGISGAAPPAGDGLLAGLQGLSAAAAWLDFAGARIEGASAGRGEVSLLAEEVQDVLVRVRAEHERLRSAGPGA